MRNAITKPRKLRRIEAAIGSPVVQALTRGNTDHRIDAIDENGQMWHLYKDGAVEKAEESDDAN